MKKKVKYLIFDFDGVLVESNELRSKGFALLFSNYPSNQVKQFMDFVHENWGLSRHAKIRHFYESILCEKISEDEISAHSIRFTNIVREKIIEAPAVSGAMEFLSNYQGKWIYSLISGSDEIELKDICQARGIDHYFIEILGSPVEKTDNIRKLINKMNWEPELCLYIGDSSSDLESANATGIDFIARNSGLTDWSLFSGVSAVNDLRELSELL